MRPFILWKYYKHYFTPREHIARYFDLYVINKMRLLLFFVATSRSFKYVQHKTALYLKSGFIFPNTWNCVGIIYKCLYCCCILERMVSSSKTPNCACSLHNFNLISELGRFGHPLSFSSNECLQTFLFVVFIRHRIPRMATAGISCQPALLFNCRVCVAKFATLAWLKL